MPFLGKPPVKASADFNRVRALPTRPAYPADFVDALSKVLRSDGPGACPVCKNGDPCRLLENQAKALWDLGTYFRGYFPMRVGAGKCLGRGTPVLMFDGSTKAVEDVSPGDQLMGPDSQPRRVVSTCRGQEELYRIVPVKGESYIVNKSHILSLKQTKMGGGSAPCQLGGRVRNLTVTEFLSKSEHFRDNWKGWRIGVDFPSQYASNPYMLGIWLGDGGTNRPDITTADPEIVNEIKAFAKSYDLRVRVSQRPNNLSCTYHLHAGRCGGYGRNPVLAWLKDLGVLGNKHVPAHYKCNDRHTRFEVLAGLLDSDGSHDGRGGFDFISQIERLADDACFLARSLGLAAYKKPSRKTCQTGASGTYYRVHISGDTHLIPCRLPRKQAPIRRQKKSVLMTGIRAEPIGMGDYFGFELEGPDRLFLLGDFTVTHNTLVSFLAPRVVGASRPLLIVPASLMQKTEREWNEYGRHWKIAKHLRFVSYEKLSRVSGADLLDLQKPDMILADECYKLKNPRTSWTRRVARYIKANPKTVFVPLGGSVMKSSIKDFTHLLQWSHKEHAPVPHHADALMEWAEALDEDVNGILRREPGVLLDLCNGFNEANVADKSLDLTQRARRVFFERCSRTPGIVIADTKDEYTGSLQVSALEYPANEKTEENFKILRTTMCRPDGWALSEAMQAWAVARQLSIGIHYDWQPRPPQEWLDARKMWAVFVRGVLAKPSANRMGLDTELQVANAVIDGKLADDYGLLEAWRRIKPTFTVNSVPVWHDDTALRLCCDWMADHPAGIVWVEHKHFAQALSKMSGIPYFGAKGLDSKGNFIQDASGPVIASIAANSAGRNLQDKWSDSLVTAAPADAERWEQLVGRTHRRGQKADVVTVQVLMGCREHLEAVPRALNSSNVKRDLLGFEQKLRIADLTWPDPAARRQGWRWE